MQWGERCSACWDHLNHKDAPNCSFFSMILKDLHLLEYRGGGWLWLTYAYVCIAYKLAVAGPAPAKVLLLEVWKSADFYLSLWEICSNYTHSARNTLI